MKKFINLMANIKIISLFVFVGMMIFFLVGKAIFYREFQVDSLSVFWLMITALAIAILKVGIEFAEEKGKISKHMSIDLLGIGVVGLLFLANWLFGFFALQGIQYLYFGLINIVLYFGACFGFWIVGKFEINSLNLCLKTFKTKL